MGNDGGSIAKRSDLVRLKAKDPTIEKDDARNARWFTCTLCKLPLKEPVAACELGNLYNKEEAIKFLLDRSLYENRPEAKHIRKQKDLITLRLKPMPDNKSNVAISAGVFNEGTAAQFCCPITLQPMNGRYRFVFLKSCGCVFSEKALKELSSKSSATVHDCPQCNKPYEASEIIPIYGEPAEVEQLRARMEASRALEKDKKRPAKDEANEQAAKKARNAGPQINSRINAQAVVALAEQEIQKQRTTDVLRSIMKPSKSQSFTASYG